MSIDTEPPPIMASSPSRKRTGHSEKPKALEQSSKHGSKRKRQSRDDEKQPQFKKSRKAKELATTQEAPSDEELLDSPFVSQKSSLFLPLAPISQRHPVEGLCAEHISPLILTYYAPFRAVIISYSNPRISCSPEGPEGSEEREVLARSIDEYAAGFVWVTADF